MNKPRIAIALGAVAVLTLTACGSAGTPDSADTANSSRTSESHTLDQVVISTYGTGTSTYADMAAVAEGMTREFETRARIITSDTAVGRLTPLVQGQAEFSRTGDEFIYAFEGSHEFASEDWGPTPTRVVWAPQVIAGFAARGDSGITGPEDLRGRNVPLLNSNPSVNDKIESLLRGAGLTHDDVTLVPMNYGEQGDGLQHGRIDVMFMSVDSSTMVELEISTAVDWLTIDPDSTELQDSLAELAPTVTLRPFSDAPGQSEGEEDIGYWYPTPVITLAETSDEVAYAMTRQIVEAFPQYESSTATTGLWSIDSAVLVPTAVPFHSGTVEYLQEVDRWTEEAQQTQDALLERERNLQEGWQTVVGMEGGELGAAWEAWKRENLAAR